MRKTIFAVLVLAVFWSAAQADTLIIDEMNQAKATKLERPTSGMTMQKVESKWGEPQEKIPAVGDPPITRWEYPKFIVYFEYKYVIHAVARR